MKSTASDLYQPQFYFELLMAEMYLCSRSAASNCIWCLSNYKYERLGPHISAQERDYSGASIYEQQPGMGTWILLLLSFPSLVLCKAKSCAYQPYQSTVKWIILTYSRFKYDWCGQSIVWYPQRPKDKSWLCFKEARICPIMVEEVHSRAGKVVYINLNLSLQLTIAHLLPGYVWKLLLW